MLRFALASAIVSFWLTGLIVAADEPPKTNTTQAAIDTAIVLDSELLSADFEEPGLLLRRLSLDLRMVVPTRAELDEFLADTSEDRWTKWVDRFLNDPMHRERMVEWLDKSLMQRRPYKNVDRAKWIAFLRQSVDEQKTIDAILATMVSSVWWNATERAQQRFFLDRDGDPHGVARDLGRIFFGKDMQCAQCHDHPQVADYWQIDYHGMLGYVSPSGLIEAKYKDDKGAEQKLQLYVERAPGDAPFESVFEKGILFRTGARVPGGFERIDTYAAPDERYQRDSLPDAFEGVPNPPSSSRRKALLDELKKPNSEFAQNWANRVWAMMMGRGLVHPLDMHHADNPSVHPQLLDLLAKHLQESNYDLRSLVRSIAISQSYQRSSRMRIEEKLRNGGVIDLPDEVLSSLTRHCQDRLAASVESIAKQQPLVDNQQKTMEQARDAWRAVQKERVTVRAELDKAEAKFQDAKKKLDESNNQLAKLTKQRDDALARSKLLEDAGKQLEQAKSLTPGEDAELAQAIATTKAKSEAAKSQLPELEKKISETTTARDTQSTSLENERRPMLEIAKQLVPVEERLRQADQAMVDARAAWRIAQADLTRLQQESGVWSRVDSWLTANKEAHNLEREVADKSQQWIVLKTKHESTTQELESAKQKLTLVTNAKGVLENQRASMQQKLQTQIAERDLLLSTITSLEKSAVLLTSTETISAAKQAILENITSRQPKLDKAQAELDMVDRELVEHEKKVSGQSAILQQQQMQWETENSDLQQAAQTKTELRSTLERTYEACEIAMQKVLEDRQRRFLVAATRGLSPEQFGWSVLQATKVLENYIAAEVAAIEKESPLAADATPEQTLVRKQKATRQALDKLRGNVDVFSNLYASGVGQSSDEFFASPDQALFMANGGSVYSWAAPSGNNAAGWAMQQSDAKEAVRGLYRSLLSREPLPKELDWMSGEISKAADKKPQVVHELVWGLLTSSEFRVYP
jgi:hypothetical protein